MTTDTKPLRLTDGALAALMGALAEASRYGAPMREAVGVCRRGALDRRVRDALSALEERMAAGQSLAQAVGAYPPLLPPFYVRIVEAADANGTVPEALARLRDYAGRRQRFAHIFSGLWWLMAICIVAIAVAIPFSLQWARMTDLPKSDSPHDIDRSAETWHYPPEWFPWDVGCAAIAASVLLLTAHFLKKTGPGAYLSEVLRLLIPALRGLTLNVAVAQFSQSLGLALWAGLTDTKALEWASAECRSPVLRGQLGIPLARMAEGTPLLDALALSPMLATPTLWMNGLAAETATAMQSMADVKEQEARRGLVLAWTFLVSILVPLVYIVFYLAPGKNLRHMF
ncbi:MAG: ral secretion pathway protein [Candidatus Hydrogenedentes bacterium]|nr:ral secretion pathway protein [Candidatus Hydrogenedentota bacterium]